MSTVLSLHQHEADPQAVMSGDLESQYLAQYNLSEEEMRRHNTTVSQELADPIVLAEQKGVQAVVVGDKGLEDVSGALARSLEIRAGFNELPEAMVPYERSSRFLFVMDYGNPPKIQQGRVAHLLRLLSFAPTADGEYSGLEVVDDLKDQISAAEIMAYHKIEDLSRCINVTSNLAPSDVMPSMDRPYGLLAYKALFQLMGETGATHLLTYLNNPAKKSLNRLGIVFEELGGRNDFVIPPTNGLDFDKYIPVCLSHKANERIFTDPEFASQFGRYPRMIAEWPLAVTALAEPTQTA